MGEVILLEFLEGDIRVHQRFGVGVDGKAVREEAALRAVFDEALQTKLLHTADVFVDAARDLDTSEIVVLVPPEMIFVGDAGPVPGLFPLAHISKRLFRADGSGPLVADIGLCGRDDG